jgi:hypothetical protein
MRLSIERWWKSSAAVPHWEDRSNDLLERHLREIATAIIVFAEQSVRDHAAASHAWRVQHKKDLQEAEQKRIAEEERKRAERQANAEQARVDHLLAQARALHQAEQIRSYVRAVGELGKRLSSSMSADEFDDWSSWALAQADRIDPVMSGAYRLKPTER